LDGRENLEHSEAAGKHRLPAIPKQENLIQGRFVVKFVKLYAKA
jgi:hypothetical protein